ncbi:MAG: hypothetical protein ABI597_09275 [Gammaproteobacteria bacterium]
MQLYQQGNSTHIINNIFKFCMTSAVTLSSILIMHNALADAKLKPVVDVYKTTQISAKQIQKKFGHDLQTFATLFTSPESITSERNAQKMEKLLIKMTNKINKMGDFSYVSVSPILYSSKEPVYITIDVVDKTDKTRLPDFLPKPRESFTDPDHLIKTWMEYQTAGFAASIKHDNKPLYKTCPAFHCLFGFEYPALKKYQTTFVTLVPKNKGQLVKILRKDQDENKRAVAALLLAHLKNGNEVLKILTPSIYDSSSNVRNNVMRVLADTLSKVKTTDFPIKTIIIAMDFPKETDRNKALNVAFALSFQQKYAHYLAKHAGPALLEQLKLSQPNLHKLSYDILVNISGKKFNERDYQAWEGWIKGKA